jgi:predicted transcriptional regulator
MKTNLASEGALISPDLLEKVQAIAAVEHRPASEILRDAIEGYMHNNSKAVPSASTVDPGPKLTPQEAGARILERRKFHPLPEGETIKSLINFGRA